MVLPWSFSWYLHGDLMVRPLYPMVLPRKQCASMILPWYCHGDAGDTIVLSWWSDGDRTEAWSFHDDLMVIPWRFHDYFMVLPW